MIELQVFDPALCCSSGVCGVDVDQALVTFSADAAWIASKGVTVTRHNLATEPLAFANSAAIRDLLGSAGAGALPAIVVDGELKLSGRYPSRDELVAWVSLAPLTANALPPRRVMEVLPELPSAACCSTPDAAKGGAACC